MTPQERYKLSLYTAVQTLRRTDTSVVEVVECSLDGMQYVKKTYPEDKRAVFGCLQRLCSDHIPNIKEVFLTADTIVVEAWIPGKTLSQLLEEKHSFTAKQIRTIVSGLLSALELIHEAKLIHRDIKPSNIIIRPDGKAVLIDYSIARFYGESDDTQRLGTVGYAAPEQYGFSPCDPKTDLYSLGVTIKRLFAGHNASARLRRAMERCTEFDPARRFSSARQVREYLKRGRYWMTAKLAAILLLICLLIGGICCTKPEPQPHITEQPEVMNNIETSPTEQVSTPEAPDPPEAEPSEEVSEEVTEEVVRTPALSEHERRLKELDDAGVPEHLRFDYEPHPTVTLSGYMRDSMTFVPDEKVAIRGYWEKGMWDILDELYVSSRYDLQKGIRYTLKGKLRYYEMYDIEILYDETDSYITANAAQ